MIIISEELKILIRKLNKDQLVELIDNFAYTTEQVQEANSQHLIDRQKLIVFLENERDRLERTIDWQKDKLRQNFKEIRALEERLRIANEEREQTKH